MHCPDHRAPVTSILAGRVGDIFGRRATIFAGACIFSIGGLFQAFTDGFRMMVFGRIISGFGVGFLSMCVPVYQSEISPAENRGRLGCIEFTVRLQSGDLRCGVTECMLTEGRSRKRR